MKLELRLERDMYNNVCTIGKLYLNGKYHCDTLEDVVRDNNRDGDLDDAGELKLYGETAIPSGRYKVIINMSPRFKKMLPRLQGIKGYEGVLIHSGNKAEDTHGCILVGQRGVNCLKGGTSTNALNSLLAVMKGFTEYEIVIVDKSV